jgi:hypothetical protein
MDNFFITALISWFLPGVGHLKSGAWKRGLIIAFVVWGMFIIGIAGGGVYYPGYGLQEGFLLYLLHVFATLGNGLGFIISYLLSQSPSNNAAAWATFEYAGRFMEVAGLLNYLAAMDAVDISLGRKE